MCGMNCNGPGRVRIDRRRFMGAVAGAAGFAIVGASAVRSYAANGRIEVGFVGLGGRGNLIAGMMAKHPAYQIVAVADYFDSVAQGAGEQLGIAKERRFSGLSGYKKVIAAGVDAMFLETPPCFFPEHVAASVDAGCHVYFAKPIACDVPGCLSILESGKKATKKQRVFLIDFQVPTDEFNSETVNRCREGLIGKIGMLDSIYCDEAFADPPKTATIESRLTNLIWVNDIELGGGMLVNAGIHAVDAALWLAGARPGSAMGASRVVNTAHHGNTRDVYSITYQYENGLIQNHRGEHLRNTHEFLCRCAAWGDAGFAEIGYMGKAWARGNKGGYAGGEVANLYVAGIARNIDKFAKCVTEGNTANDTLQRSVDSTLAVILGREAAMRNTVLTWDDLIRENRKLDFDTTGLKI
ncbi:MAG: Gfo/Idh/MocA family oxidoreductase [Phycisphaerae bacterium]|nr:Gfo/Idh/MocA family oxidoreductase [Phycisphaerae bacterium]